MKRIFILLITVSFLLLQINELKAQATVFLQAAGTITNPAHWGTSTDGLTGTLTDFSQNNTYIFNANNASRTLNSTWTITAGSIVSIGSGLAAFTLDYAPGATMGVAGSTANVIFSNLSTFSLSTPYNFDPSKTTMNVGSTFIYAAGTTSVATEQYQKLVIDNNVATNSAVIDISDILQINTGKILMIDNGGNLNISGSTNIGGSISGDNTGSISRTGSGNCSLIFTSGNASFSQISLLGSGFCYLASSVICSTNFILGNIILDLNGISLTLNGNIDFGGSALRGSPSTSIVIGGAGSITGSLNMDNQNSFFNSIYDLTLNRNGSTLTFANIVRIWGSLTPSDGTIATGGNLLIISTSSQKGRIGIVGTTGFITGTPTVYIFKPAGTTGWVNFCSGGVTGKTFADWNSSFAITCPSGCPDGSTVNSVSFTSVYTYNEAATTGSASAAAHYVVLPGTGTTIDSKTGYWVYLGNGFPNTSAMFIPLTGAINTKASSGNIVLSLSASANTEDGWNLIANPYPSPIQVTQFIASAGGSNIDQTLLAYDPDSDSNVPLTAGGVIPMGQAFMVRALVNNTTVTPDETWKTATADNTAIQKQQGSNIPLGVNGKAYYFNDFMIDLQSTGVPKNFFTQAYFMFGNNYTSGFDNGNDAYSMASAIDPGTPRIISLTNNAQFLRNALPALNGVVNIPILVSTGYSGVYSLKPVNMNKLPAGACVQLVDIANNITYDLKTGAYTTTIAANQTIPQFELKITLNSSSLAQLSVLDPLCKNGTDGSIVAKGSGQGPWNYTWKDLNSNVLQVKNNTSFADTLFYLAEGIYQIDVNTVGSCDNAHADFTLNALTPLPIAQFSANTNQVFANNNVPVSFTNLSSNASDFTWDFGNGVSVSSLHASQVFNDLGTYKVKLSASNGPCEDISSASLEVKVIANPLGISNQAFDENSIYASKDEKGLFVSLNFSSFTEVEISACNILGQVLVKTTKVGADKTKFYLAIPDQEKVVFVTVQTSDKVKTFKVLN